MSKYEPLTEYLAGSGQIYVTLSYDEIETIIDAKLPERSPYLYREWWANDRSHVQGAAWLNAGYQTTDVKLGSSVTFEKIR